MISYIINYILLVYLSLHMIRYSIQLFFIKVITIYSSCKAYNITLKLRICIK
nr:MAG TPA: hypothetical protein [Crassvirales sp.]